MQTEPQLEREETIWTPGRIKEDNIRTDLKETGCEDVN
jgi:hypothetical protein